MKKALVILLALTMVMSMFAVVPFGASAAEELAIGAVAADYKPEGTAVKTADDFAKMTADGKYYLAADITIDKTYEASFTGTFDGNGKTITTSVPVFAQFNGTAKNVTVAGSIAVTAGEYAGAFANVAGNAADATFTNIMNKAILTSDVAGLGGIVGLVVGADANNAVTFTDCANYGKITSNSTSDVLDSAGIAAHYVSQNTTGEAKLQFINCANYADITAAGRPAGISGTVQSSATFTNCYNAGKIRATVNYCAGIVSRLGADDQTDAEFVFDGCVNDADITCAGTKQVKAAGIVAYATKCAEYTFKNCTNNGNIAGEPVGRGGLAIIIAGIIADGASETAELATFENCVNNGDIITGTTKWNREDWMTAAGIVAKQYFALNAVFKNCVNNGEISSVVTATSASKKNAAGIVGYTDCNLEFYNCINNGDIAGSYAAGIVASAKGGVNWATKDLVLSGCGNTGDVDGCDSVGGLVGAVFCYETRNVVITNSFNTGDIYTTGTSDIYVSGLVAFCHTRDVSTSTIKYCYVAGSVNSAVAESATDVADVTPGASAFVRKKQYKFTANGETYYFHLPYAADSVNITGTKVVPLYDFMEGSVGSANGFEVANGETIESGKWCYFTADTGRFFAFKSSAAGTIAIDGETVTIDGAAQNTQCLDVVVSKSATCLSSALINAADNWEFKSIDMDDNIILDTVDVPEYILGLATTGAFRVVAVEGENKTCTADDLKSGKLAATLNDMAGEDIFFQNLDSELFEVDAFPTTDKAHAKVVENIVGGGYTNPVFDETDDSGSPETGDATIYVAVALAVSTIALAGFMVAKKVKEN